MVYHILRKSATPYPAETTQRCALALGGRRGRLCDGADDAADGGSCVGRLRVSAREEGRGLPADGGLGRTGPHSLCRIGPEGGQRGDTDVPPPTMRRLRAVHAPACRVCGCFTNLKLRLPHEECLLGRWAGVGPIGPPSPGLMKRGTARRN